MLRIYLVFLVALVTSSCTLVDEYIKPKLETPANWSIEYPWHLSEPADQLKKGSWWEIFKDDDLNRLESLALDQNPNLKIAMNRVEQAKSIITITKASLYPEVDIMSGASRGIISQNKPTYEQSTMPITTSQNDFNLRLAVNYELDLFNRVKNTIKASKASEESEEAQYENIKLLLASEIASDYFALCELDNEIEIVVKSIELQRKALEFIKARYDLGIANGIDLSQQQNQLDTSLAQLDILNSQRSQIEHALAFLTGSFANDFHIEKKSFSNVLPSIPASLPSDVIQQRPDVAAAERMMAEANAQIGVARAAFFPTINLSPLAGVESSSLSTITNSSSFLWALGVSATQPLFNAGKIKANVKISEINYQSSIEYYRQTVLRAMQEVEDGLSGNILLAKAEENINRSVRSAKQSIHLTNARYEGGLGIYLDVINSEQIHLASQRRLIQNKGEQFQVAIYLIKALGGKWNADI